MRLSVINTTAEHEAIRETWQSLAGQHPFLNWYWQQRWWEEFGESAKRLTVVLRNATDEIVAIAPFYLQQHWAKGNIIRWVGSGRACSDWMSLISEPDNARSVAEHLTAWLMGQATYDCEAPAWNLLELDGVVGGAPACDGMMQDFAYHAHHTEDSNDLSVWRVELEAGFEAFVRSRIRSTNRRKLRKPMREYVESGRSVYIESETSAERLATFDLLVDLHCRRRTQLGDVGCFGEERFDRFMRNLIEDYAELGQLRLGHLELDGKAIACCLGFHFDGVFYVYQSGIDPDALDCSPGFLMYSQIIAKEIERGTRAIDFLRGDERYKKELGCQPLPCRCLRIYGNDRSSVVRHQLGKASHSIGKWVKSLAR